MPDQEEMEISLAEARSKLFINRHALEIGLSEQPELFAQVSYMAALYASLRDQAKNNVSVVEAETASLIRQQFMDTGEKVTEAAIKEELAQHSATKKANKNYLSVKKEADIWQAMKDSYDQRGKMIRELVHLYISGYYQRQEIKGEQIQSQNSAADYARKRLSDVRKPLIPRGERD